jgi:hypothetical protein
VSADTQKQMSVRRVVWSCAHRKMLTAGPSPCAGAWCSCWPPHGCGHPPAAEPWRRFHRRGLPEMAAQRRPPCLDRTCSRSATASPPASFATLPQQRQTLMDMHLSTRLSALQAKANPSRAQCGRALPDPASQSLPDEPNPSLVDSNDACRSTACKKTPHQNKPPHTPG